MEKLQDRPAALAWRLGKEAVSASGSKTSREPGIAACSAAKLRRADRIPGFPHRISVGGAAKSGGRSGSQACAAHLLRITAISSSDGIRSASIFSMAAGLSRIHAGL